MHNGKNIEELLDRFVQEERTTASNPFMVTRIMSVIKNNQPPVTVTPVWRMAMAAAVLVLAVMAGVAAGNLYHTGNTSTGTVLINDDAMEHLELYTAAAEE